jgi:two-component system, NarL family, sensor histidine kinase DesK
MRRLARGLGWGQWIAMASLLLYPLGLVDALAHHSKLDVLLLQVALAVLFVAVWIWFWLIAVPAGRSRLTAVGLGLLIGIAACLIVTDIGRWGPIWAYPTVAIGFGLRPRYAIPAIFAMTVVALVSIYTSQSSYSPSVRSQLPTLLFEVGIEYPLVGLAAVAVSQLAAANRELRRARAAIAHLAVEEERARFARDLHDLLGHSLSVIALKSELAGRLVPHGSQAASEVHDIERVSRDALREVREAVAGYRQPTLAAELAGARTALAAAGIECAVTQEAGPLPAAAEAVFAWTVREGATNVIRHSRARRCTIRLSQKNGTAEIDVVDDGRPGSNGEHGSGLKGLAERVAARGGKLDAGPLPHEGYRLRVVLPI